ncbi:MAG: AzlD domain-containing protein [Burkholderiales bacterium]
MIDAELPSSCSHGLAARRALLAQRPTILGALGGPEPISTQGSLNAVRSGDKLAAAAVAILVGWRTRHTQSTTLPGMLALHAARRLDTP